MTHSPSQIAACEDKLQALLAVDATLSAIDGPPQLSEPQTPMREHVFIYENTMGDQAFDSTGNAGGAKAELVTLRVGVFVQKLEAAATETSPQAFVRTRDRADVLAAAVEAVVRNNATRDAASTPPWDFAEVMKVERFSAAYDNVRGLIKIVTVEITINGL